MKLLREYLGEALGTFILVLFGCGSVSATVLLGVFNSLLEIAIIWGLGVAIAIFITRNYCPAHLNPAVSLAMSFIGNLRWRKLPFYILSQTIGAFLAGFLLYFLFADAIAIYEGANHIVRGTPDSYKSALYFGEFFPNPGLETLLPVSVYMACWAEFIGTFLLVFVILRVTEKPKLVDNTTPFVIGLTVTIIICLIAPFTQAGLNPARDFGPRMVAYLMGWGSAALPSVPYSFLTVYIVSPLLAGGFAAFLQRLVFTKRKNVPH
ncbi:aquaporin family protein [Maribacter sp. PR1]|uniref:MIP/aquaporin family protein n=1 Tax=Maribacter cobaltidurans TaxID=1178778 RepID=A0ABU7J121_9FLAO|nr:MULTISPECIES: MIP/aquaporin family protein [Maribacter]MDC6391091.1 aquaporin family protein [Maribacter sp. PR1]MEE1978483.1 MIP/aquaporin family protein [Maribacter cobaltidurans]